MALGDFVVPTHCNIKTHADPRVDEASAAFDGLAEIDTTEWHVVHRGCALTMLVSDCSG